MTPADRWTRESMRRAEQARRQAEAAQRELTALRLEEQADMYAADLASGAWAYSLPSREQAQATFRLVSKLSAQATEQPQGWPFEEAVR